MTIAYIFSQAVLIEQILICFDHRQKKKKKNQTLTIHGMSDCAGYNIVNLFY